LTLTPAIFATSTIVGRLCIGCPLPYQLTSLYV
jgi:hypothetical protein